MARKASQKKLTSAVKKGKSLMLLTDYLVAVNADGELRLVVDSILPKDCELGRCAIRKKMDRMDLVQEFLQDGLPADCLLFPALPPEVAALLESGGSVSVIDVADNSDICCKLDDTPEVFKQGSV